MQRKTIEGWIDRLPIIFRLRENTRSRIATLRPSRPPRNASNSPSNRFCSYWVSSIRRRTWPGEKKPFEGIAQQISQRQLLENLAAQNLNHSVPLPRLLLLMNFWGQFYLTAKYGFGVEQLAPAQELFRLEDATLAVRHAEECHGAASALRYLDKDQIAALNPARQ